MKPRSSAVRRRTLGRFAALVCVAIVIRFFWSTGHKKSSTHEIRGHNIVERVTTRDKTLNVQKHNFLQARLGRDERPELLGNAIQNGAEDYWDHFQKPFITGIETSRADAQNVVASIDQLLQLNGWVGALCPTLKRPFGQNSKEDAYDDLARNNKLYYIAIVVHSADHFLVDQLAVIVQLAKRLGTSNIFVSMLDYESTDSTPTLTDLCEAVLVLLGVPFRIRRVPGMTADPKAAYYPLEEAHTRNLALEPLHELLSKRHIKFHRVIWLKGFTCPTDIFETLKVSEANEAAMVCGMDWAEQSGSYIYSDRWRTRDIAGEHFRQSKSSATGNSVPPRDLIGAARYGQHLPFQVFCCESGTHVVDPAQSYYKNLRYRSGMDFHNLSSSDPVVSRAPDAPCLDSAQAYFCRDLWLTAAGGGVREDPVDVPLRKRSPDTTEEDANTPALLHARDDEAVAAAGQADEERRKGIQVGKGESSDGSHVDAIPDDAPVPEKIAAPRLPVPNAAFRPARILVNPRCVTTYAGVSHIKLAQDLFGSEAGDSRSKSGKYILDDWEGAPETFLCQEQTQTGGRKAAKSQRRIGFSIHDELDRIHLEKKKGKAGPGRTM